MYTSDSEPNRSTSSSFLLSRFLESFIVVENVGIFFSISFTVFSKEIYDVFNCSKSFGIKGTILNYNVSKNVINFRNYQNFIE